LDIFKARDWLKQDVLFHSMGAAILMSFAVESYKGWKAYSKAGLSTKLSRPKNSGDKTPQSKTQRPDSKMAARTIALITGGNNGIGYETVKSLLQSKRPYHLLVGSRSPEKGKLAIEKLHEECPNATNTMELLQVDLTSDESIEKAFEQVKYKQGRVDVLINNAGESTC
jgi:hypothetical protein